MGPYLFENSKSIKEGWILGKTNLTINLEFPLRAESATGRPILHPENLDYNRFVISQLATHFSKGRKVWTQPWVWALLSCFLLLALLACRKDWDADLGIHLKGGQWITQNHRVPSSDVYTYSVPDHPFLDIEWLYQCAFFLIFLAGGYSSVSVFNILLILLAFGVSWMRLRETRCPLWLGVPLLAWAVLACEFRFHVRPENLSWLLMVGMLWVLEERARGRPNRLWLLPLLQWVWVNTEGMFPLGLALIVIFLVSHWIHNRKIDIPLAGYGALSTAVCFLNPYGLDGFLYPLAILKTLHSEVFKSNIMEFDSPWNPIHPDAIPNQVWMYKIFCLFLLLLLLATFRRRKAHEFLLAGFFFYFSATGVRQIPLFILACLPVAGACWKDLPWLGVRKFQETFLSGNLTAWVFSLLLLGLGVRVVTNAFYVSGQRPEHFGLGVDGESLPVRAADFLIQNHLDGRILNELGCGDWLEWSGQKVFIDGRSEVFGEDFFSQYVSSRQGGGVIPLADKYRADIIFFSLPNPWLAGLQGSGDWRNVYYI